jgi:hypothetical protein
MDIAAVGSEVAAGNDMGVSNIVGRAVAVAAGTLVDENVAVDPGRGVPVAGLHPKSNMSAGRVNKNSLCLKMVDDVKRYLIMVLVKRVL